MGLSASQGRMLLLTARKNDLEFRAQQISQQRLNLTSQLEKISSDYEEATSNRDMVINCMGTQTSNSGTSTTFNLTYSALTSGLIAAVKNGNITEENAGIQANSAADSFYNGGYKVNGMYRLTDADGNIVVSSIDEIPGISESSIKELEAGESSASISTTTPKTVDAYSMGIVHTSDKYSFDIAEKTETKAGEGIELKDNEYYLSTEGTATKSRSEAAQVGVKDDGTGENVLNTYKIITLNSVSDDNWSSYKFAEVSKTTKTYNAINKDGGSIQKGTGKNEYKVGDKTYVVDEALSVDNGSGSTGCSNYLQECLRNGLYTIESYNSQSDATTEDDKWSTVSWDSLSQITDENYDDDDDAASAKYKRLQQQIETKDKKLEMELDNIETQRSAVTTEVESVQKVIDDNVEKTFKTFA